MISLKTTVLSAWLLCVNEARTNSARDHLRARDFTIKGRKLACAACAGQRFDVRPLGIPSRPFSRTRNVFKTPRAHSTAS